MMSHAVFLDQQTFSSNVSVRPIESQVNTLTCWPTTQPHEIIERAKNADIIVTNKVVLDEKILQQLPQLKLICIAATGTNNVDLTTAKKLGIAITNVAGYAKNSVAQYVFSQLLHFYSQPHHHLQNVNEGQWQKSQTFCLHGNGSEELAGKTLGLIGYGSLAKAVERIARTFEMNILIAERPKSVTMRSGRVPFDDVIQQADILSLHCPHTPDTENLINKEVLTLMKPSAVLINTARGALINETELHHALINHDIRYAILDVLKQEPPTNNHALTSNQPANLAITAHIAWASIESQQRLINLIAQNIVDFLTGKTTNRVEGQ